MAANVLRLAPVAAFITEPNKYTEKSKDLTHSEGIKFSHQAIAEKAQAQPLVQTVVSSSILESQKLWL